MHVNTHTCTQTHTPVENEKKKQGPELSPVEHLSHWGRLPRSASLFHGWGDWLDSDNETNYVKSSVCVCVCVCPENVLAVQVLESEGR